MGEGNRRHIAVLRIPGQTPTAMGQFVARLIKQDGMTSIRLLVPDEQLAERVTAALGPVGIDVSESHAFQVLGEGHLKRHDEIWAEVRRFALQGAVDEPIVVLIGGGNLLSRLVVNLTGDTETKFANDPGYAGTVTITGEASQGEMRPLD